MQFIEHATFAEIPIGNYYRSFRKTRTRGRGAPGATRLYKRQRSRAPPVMPPVHHEFHAGHIAGRTESRA
jgi:hypothetical protein